MEYRVYLVEDEPKLNDVLSLYLKNQGWDVKSFLDDTDALRHINDGPDLWVTDLMLPFTDGYDILRKVKAHNEHTPVIIISALGESIDKLVGLELGCDDYIAKPFLPRELVIRAQKLLKGKAITEAHTGSLQIIHFHEYEINVSKRVVSIKGNTINLTTKEFDLVYLLAKNQGRILSREQFIKHIWGDDYCGSDRAVDDLIRRVRNKLTTLQINTVYGYGYRIN